MAIGTRRSSLKHLGELFSGGTAVGLSDRELLCRYTATRDGTAFESLVARHGPMVLATCRAVLRDHHDAEDAFQAAFLVLARQAASIRTGEALGGWLHRVAYRAAVRLNIEAKRRRRHEARVSSMEIPTATRSTLDFDVYSILHEEIDRLPNAQRLPVVLCDLEGLTYEQAAARLHSTAPTVYHRLARGRQRLRDRLIRRGVTAMAVGAAMELTRASTMAAVPAAWAQAVVQVVTGGPVPATVAALTHTLIRSLLMTRLTIASVAILAVVTLASAGVVAVGAARPGAPSSTSLERTTKAPSTPADEPKPPAKSVAVASHEPGTLTVEARDLASDVPVPDVRLEFGTGGGSKKVSAATDAAGAARFSRPASANSFFVSAARDGFVPQAIRWVYDSNSPVPPDRLLFQMEKATTIFGRVVDQDQKPVAGATVVIDVSKGYPKSRQWVDLKYESTKTDASGHWSFSGVPAKPDSVELAAYHHLYLEEHANCSPEKFQPLSALLDGTATVHLRRGTRIDGKVVAPDGHPVPGAEVFYGEGRRYATAIPPVKTDSQGKFTLGIKPGTISTLTARAAGFGPTLQRIRVGPDPLHVDLTLPTAHVLRGRVIDPAGKPIAHARLNVSWSGPEMSTATGRGSEAIARQLTTDADGRFVWKDAPDRGCRVGIYAKGFAGKENWRLASDVDHKIVLIPPTRIKGTVVDGETGQPLPRFSLWLGAVWDRGQLLIWQSGDMVKSAKKAPGSFEHTIDQPAHEYIVRVSADGYLAEDSARFSPDGTPHAFTFRLTRAGPIRGTVLSPDGSRASNGFVYLVPAEEENTIDYLKFWNGDVAAHERSRTIHAKIGPEGQFSLPPQKTNFALVALTDAGFAIVRRRDLRGDDTLRLQRWAHVSGTVVLDGKPAANLGLSSSDPDSPRPIAGEPRIERRFDIETDVNGRFDLPRVMPGRLVLGRWVSNGVPRRNWFVALATLDVESGSTYDLKIGRSGRRVTGRLVLPRADGWMIRKAEIVPQTSTEKQPVSIGIHVLPDGRFQAEDLRAGDYNLRVALHEPPPADACGWGRLLGEFSHAFNVPDVAANVPLDLGVLRPAEIANGPLEVGDKAPDFTVKSLDGKDIKLADFRGKFVLLDFWATWCAPCVAVVPNLKAIHDQFSNDPRFVLISLSLDERPDDAEFFMRQQKLSWLQGFIGPDSPVVSAYGATAIPATFLISPEGKILARDLGGEKAMAAVTEALKP